MILPIYLYGHPLLRRPAADIDPRAIDRARHQAFVSDLWETMYHSDGIGLAAPQVGVSERTFVIDANALAEDFPEVAGFKRTFINAHLTDARGDGLETAEGCLSLPGITEKVKRPAAITVEYLDERLEPRRETFQGYQAVVVAHEYDHLDGRLFIDHLGALRKRLLKNKLAAIARGNVSCKYRVVAAK